MRRLSIAYVGLCATVIGGVAAIPASPANGAFAQMEPIDTHAHVLKDHPQFTNFLQRYHLHLLDIVMATKDDPTFHNLESKIAAAKTVVRDSRGHAGFARRLIRSSSRTRRLSLMPSGN
jgi:hypothetical protein